MNKQQEYPIYHLKDVGSPTMTETTRKKLRELAGEERLIPGIYNYCDYWCARCLFTARCLNYAMELERANEAPPRELDDESFGDELLDILTDTVEMLREMAEEAGVDLEALEADAELNAAMAEKERRFERLAEHPLATASMAYIKMVDGWFEAAGPAFQTKEDALNAQVRLGLDEAGPAAEAGALADAVAVIRWYQFSIHVKLQTALHHAEDEPHPLLADEPRHSDGIAKVALIAIDRSIDAWDTLERLFPQHETETLELLAHLARLRQAAEAGFPDARAFIRPGFDELEMWA